MKTNLAALPFALQRKVRAVATAKAHLVRRVSKDEARIIQELDGWQHGWFRIDSGAQIVLRERTARGWIVFCIGH